MKKLIIVTFVVLSIATPSFAGTTQIYSPAGLPQIKGRNYFAPRIDSTPNVRPTVPANLQKFPGPVLPYSHSSASVIDPEYNLLPTSEHGDIESFFQYSPPAQISTPEKTSHSPPKAAGIFIWHVLDNIGIPMIGNKENNLDPSLRQAPYVIPGSNTSPKGTETPLKNEIQAP